LSPSINKVLILPGCNAFCAALENYRDLNTMLPKQQTHEKHNGQYWVLNNTCCYKYFNSWISSCRGFLATVHVHEHVPFSTNYFI